MGPSWANGVIAHFTGQVKPATASSAIMRLNLQGRFPPREANPGFVYLSCSQLYQIYFRMLRTNACWVSPQLQRALLSSGAVHPMTLTAGFSSRLNSSSNLTFMLWDE